MMAIDFDTPLDRVPLRRSGRSLNAKAMLQGTCLVFLETASFAVSTLLLVLGLPLFVFLLLVGWDLALLFSQLGNLADHYRTAAPVQRLLFSSDLKIAFLLASGGAFLVRLPGFLRRLDSKLAEGNRRHV